MWVIDIEELCPSRKDHFYLVEYYELLKASHESSTSPPPANGLWPLIRVVQSESDCRREIFSSQLPADILEDNELLSNFKKFEEFVKKQKEDSPSSQSSHSSLDN